MPLDLARDTVARWADPKPEHIPLLKEAGIDGVLLEAPNAAFESACASAGLGTAPVATAAGAVTRGLWPGVRSEPRPGGGDDLAASASREPWVDANGHLVAFERVVGGRVPVMAHQPPPGRMVAHETVELALAEARVNGGNFVLAFDARYRDGLARKDARALAAWRALGQTTAWLKQNAGLFGRPAVPTITALVETGGFSGEIANLLYRRNGSPLLAPAAAPPPPGRAKCLVACGLKAAPPDVQGRILAHARSGAIVVVDSPPDPSWKPAKQERDRTFHGLGSGSVLAYHKRIADPSEFALDCIDLVTHRHRAARLWNAPSVIALATEGARPGELLLHLLNYGSAITDEVQVRVAGHYKSAELLRPGQAPRKLDTAARGTTTEVFPPDLGRVAVVRFG
jgi:hypothetical protein